MDEQENTQMDFDFDFMSLPSPLMTNSNEDCDRLNLSDFVDPDFLAGASTDTASNIVHTIQMDQNTDTSYDTTNQNEAHISNAVQVSQNIIFTKL